MLRMMLLDDVPILLQNEDGSFAEAQRFSVGDAPQSVALAAYSPLDTQFVPFSAARTRDVATRRASKDKTWETIHGHRRSH